MATSPDALWRSIRRLLATRQHLVVYLAAMALVDAGLLALVVWAGPGFSSFSDLSRREFNEAETLEHAFGTLGSDFTVSLAAALAAYLVAGSLIIGWLRVGFIRGLGGDGATLRPPLAVVLRMSVYWLGFELATLGVDAMLAHSLVLPGLVALPLASAAFLYADYAIALDDAGVWAAMVCSLRIVRATLRRSVFVWLIALFVAQIVAAAFAPGFDSSSHVQPTFLLAYLLAGVVQQFLLDTVLVTFYLDARRRRLGRISEDAAPAPDAASPDRLPD
jgi:hypothetical protein